MLTLIRETAFIKEWQTPRGAFIDSKYRWLGVEPSVEGFLGAWRGAREAEKFDLEAAFEFYPYELEEDIEEILGAIAGMSEGDRVRAKRMAGRLFRGDSELSGEMQDFLRILGEHLERTAAPMRLVGENRWFAAYANDAGFHIDTKVETMAGMPTEEELEGQMETTLSLAYRRILQTVKEHPYLLHPRAGEQALPM